MSIYHYHQAYKGGKRGQEGCDRSNPQVSPINAPADWKEAMSPTVAATFFPSPLHSMTGLDKHTRAHKHTHTHTLKSCT